MTEHEDVSVGLEEHARNEARLREVYGVRLTDRVEFVVSSELGFAVEPGLTDWPDLGEDPEAFGDLVVNELFDDEELPPDIIVRPTSLGRGAEGPAVLFELVASGLTPVTAGVGAVLTWLSFSGRVAQAWRYLRKRMPAGQVPVLSLGTIKYLCIQDLHQRLGSLENVHLLSANDLSREVLGDTGYTGEDTFSLVFTRGSEMFVYIVDSIGQVIHFGTGFQEPHRQLRFQSDGHPLPADTPHEPRNMLCDEDPDAEN